MCLNTFLCETCDYEFDQVFRMGDCDEEKSLAYDSKSGECRCGEVLIYRDEQCKVCKKYKVKDWTDYLKKMKKLEEKIKKLSVRLKKAKTKSGQVSMQLRLNELIESGKN